MGEDVKRGGCPWLLARCRTCSIVYISVVVSLAFQQAKLIGKRKRRGGKKRGWQGLQRIGRVG